MTKRQLPRPRAARSIAHPLPAWMTALLLLSMLMMPAVKPQAAPSAGEQAAPPPYDLNSLTWRALHFATSIMGMPLHAKMKARILSRDEAQRHLVSPREGHPIPPADAVLQLEVFSSFINDKDIHTRLMINPGNAAALQRTRVELTPGDERYKAYRFTGEGIFILRRVPRRGEAGKPFTEWTGTHESFIPYPGHHRRPGLASDTAALLYMGSAANFTAPGDSRSFIAYFDDSFHVITMEYRGIEGVRADFRAGRQDAGSRRIMSYRDALRMTIRAHPLGHPNEESTLQIAGLEPPVELFIDQEMRVPLELRGRFGFIGEISLRLDRAELR